MRFFCTECGAGYTKATKDIPAEGMKFACEKCGSVVSVERPVMQPVKEESDNIAQAEEEFFSKPAPVKKTKRTEALKKKISSLLSNLNYIHSLPTGQSGAVIRFRDLFYALCIGLDYRKTLVVAAAIFIGSLLSAGLGALGSFIGSTGPTIALIVSQVVFWALVILALGITSYLTDRELQAESRLPLSEGIHFVKAQWKTVLGTPFVFVAGILALMILVALLSVAGRIPYAGPILYGLTFLLILVCSFFAVVILLGLGLVTFSYIPLIAKESQTPIQAAKRFFDLFSQNVSRFLVHYLAVLVCGVLLWALLQFMFMLTMGLIGLVSAKLMGSEYGAVMLAIPGELFGYMQVAGPKWLHLGMSFLGDAALHHSIAGWLTGLMVLAFTSIMSAFVLVYVFGAGVINYHLLTKKEDKRREVVSGG